MALLTAQALAITGTLDAPAAVSVSDTIAANGNLRFIYTVINGGGSPDTVTVIVPGTDEFGQAIPDVAVSVAAGATRTIYLGPNQARAADPATGLITITHSFITSVTATLKSIPA